MAGSTPIEETTNTRATSSFDWTGFFSGISNSISGVISAVKAPSGTSVPSTASAPAGDRTLSALGISSGLLTLIIVGIAIYFLFIRKK